MTTRDHGKGWATSNSGDPSWLSRRASTYAESGVDRVTGSEVVSRIAGLAASTFNLAVKSSIGGFGGLFSLDGIAQDGKLLVASTDGVGTKALVASALDRYATIGEDLVAVNVDDIVVYGARPLFFLDFLVVEHVDSSRVEQIVSGVASGCLKAGCPLLGGEVAEHPGTRGPRDFDLVGFVVGLVGQDALITGEKIRPGDALVGFGAAGMRSDGYSFVRQIFGDRPLDDLAYPGASHSLGDELLRPSKIYTPNVLNLIGQVDVHGLAHVTGGGIAANVQRILPPNCDALISRASWPIPPIFDEMRRWAGVSPQALEESLPIGIGMAAIIEASQVPECLSILESNDQDAYLIGAVVEGAGQARFIDQAR